MHVTLLEGSNGTPALKHMEILGYTHRHSLFTQEPAVTASALEAPSFAGRLNQDIFEYPGLQASCFSNCVNSISLSPSQGSLVSGVSTLLQLQDAIVSMHSG